MNTIARLCLSYNIKLLCNFWFILIAHVKVLPLIWRCYVRHFITLPKSVNDWWLINFNAWCYVTPKRCHIGDLNN